MAAQLVRLFHGGALPIGAQHLGRDTGEQVVGQAQRPQLLELADLGQHRGQRRRPGIGLELRPGRPPEFGAGRAVRGGGPQERLQGQHRAGRQALRGAGTEVVVGAAQGRAHQPIHLPRSWRLEAEGPAALVGPQPQAIGVPVFDQGALGKPGRQGGLILLAGLAEAERGPDLRPVVLDGAPAPLVLQELLGRHADLFGDEDDDRTRQVLLARREARLELEALEQQCEAQAGGARLVGQQVELGGQ